MNKNILNKILIEWNNSDIEDSGFLKASDIKKKMNYQLIYTLDIPRRIKLFDNHLVDFNKFKDKVYINDEHVELEDGYTVNEYEPGEYKVYIDGFDELNRIGYCAFYRCTELTDVTIGNSVTEIGKYAFRDCTGLTSITIPNSVTTISYDAFSSCTNLTNVTIPNSVTTISNNVFEGCTSLTSITIPNSMSMIASSVFYYCTGLRDVIISDSVKTIGSSAFYSCTGLTSITIPKSITNIGGNAFKNCINLETVYVEDIDKFNEIKFGNEFSYPTYYGAKLIELKK